VIDYHNHIIQQSLPLTTFFDDHDYFIQLQFYQQELAARGIQILVAKKVACSHTQDEEEITLEESLIRLMDVRARQSRSTSSMSTDQSPSIDRIHLQDNNGRITSNEKILLEQQWPTYKLEKYYCRCWKISTSQLADYDWTIYSINYTKAPGSYKNFLIKLMTGWLPVYHRLNKITNTNYKCPNCQQEETIGHIFQCQCRTTWKNKLMDKLQEFLTRNNTPTSLQDTIVNQVTTLTSHPSSTQKHYHYTIFAGLLPKTWTTNTTSIPHNHKDHQLHRQWAIKLSTLLTHHGYDAWILRNKQIHKEGDTTTNIHEYLNTKIHQLYNLQNEIGHHDRAIFHQPIEDRLNLSEKQKMEWIDHTTKTIKVSMEDFKKKQTQGQKDI